MTTEESLKLIARIVGIIAIVAAVVGGVLWVRAHYISIGERNVQQKWDDAEAKRKADDAEAARQRDEAERRKEQTRQQEADRIANEQAEKQREQQARDQRTDATVRSLRATITDLNQQLDGLPAAGADSGSATVADGARTARELLGTCADRYVAVAKDADRFRDQISGLQSFVTNACQTGQPGPASAPTGN